MNNYSPFEFPVFCLNFDYMRILTTVLQTEINKYVTEFQKLERLLNKTYMPVRVIRNKPPKVSKSVSPPRGIDRYTLEKEENSKFMEVLRKREISIKPKMFLNNSQLSKEEFLEQSMNKLIKKNARPIFEKGLMIIVNAYRGNLIRYGFKRLSTTVLGKKLGTFLAKLNLVEKKMTHRYKRHFFFLLINLLIRSHEADGVYKYKLKRQVFDSLRLFYYNRIDAGLDKYEGSLKRKAFFSLVKNHYDNEYKRSKCNSIHSFYEDKLRYKAFHGLRTVKPAGLLTSDSLAYSNSLTGSRGSRQVTGTGRQNTRNNLETYHNNRLPDIPSYEDDNANNPYEDIYDEIENPNDYSQSGDPKMNTNMLEFKHFGGKNNNNHKPKEETPSDTFLDKTNENIFDNHLGKDDKGSEVDKLLSKLESKYKSLSKLNI
jgi:hypothetical protein